jgi:Kef-type K+ transport system membrane component KefB
MLPILVVLQLCSRFFAIFGAKVDLRGINLNVFLLAGGIVANAILTKLVGCGPPSILFLKDKGKTLIWS